VSSPRVRWGVVGTGGIGRRTVGDLRLCESAEVVAVASREQQRADAFAADLVLPHAFGSYSATFPREGAGYLPMFRAVNERILAGEIEHPTHPVTATVDVLAAMEQIRDRLADERDQRQQQPTKETARA
jgi:hypothetical protein